MYRIIETDGTNAPREIERFESAYAGLERLRRALLTSTDRANRWQLVDSNGAVLVDAADVLEAAG